MFGMRCNTMLLTDFYKACHMNMYDKHIAKMTSYLTPRSSRFPQQDWVMFFGLQIFIKKYLVNDFKENFFDLDWEEIEKQYKLILTKSLLYTEKEYGPTIEKIKALHELGYLPIEIRALPEGSKVPMGVPCVEISVTDGRFPWVGQAIECMLSCNIWHPMVSATVAYRYRELAHEFAKKSSDKADGTMAMCDFSLRGQESMESAISSSVAWLSTGLKNSSTVPARFLIEECYPETNTDTLQVYGLTSTEHSVMTTDFAINGDERETYRRLLTEVYPNTSFAAVSDSYDYWHVLTEILPELRPEIEAHKGFIGVRHDSADPVEALCGIPTITVNLDKEMAEDELKDLFEKKVSYCTDVWDYEWNTEFKVRFITSGPKLAVDQYVAVCKNVPAPSGDEYYDILKLEKREPTYEEKGMVETIWDLFGGAINSKGYKVCNPHVKAVYGDSITLERAKKIFHRLDVKRFAIENISLGVGSFSMEAVEWDNRLYPFTRDTFSIAIKCTWAELDDGRRIPVFKDPKNFSGKKSQKGLCLVKFNKTTGKFEYTDGHLNPEELERDPENAFITYFREGVVATRLVEDFNRVRERVDSYFK